MDHQNGLYLLMFVIESRINDFTFRIQVYPYENLTDDEKKHIDAPISHDKITRFVLRNELIKPPLSNGNFKIIQFDGRQSYWPIARKIIPVLRLAGPRAQVSAAERTYAPSEPGAQAAKESFMNTLVATKKNSRSRSRCPSRSRSRVVVVLLLLVVVVVVVAVVWGGVIVCINM